MKLVYTDTYNRMYSELTRNQQNMVDQTIELFREYPYHDSLRNHALRKPMSGARSIWVDDDIRIVFTERGDYFEVLLMRVGPHDKVYC